MAEIAKMVEEIEKMTVTELNELVKAIEEKFGVSAAAMAVAAPAGAAGAAAAPAEEQTEFTVVLKEFPADKKVPIIKAVREITGLGLGEAKALVEALPATVKEGISKADAEEAAKKLKEQGAAVDIK